MAYKRYEKYKDSGVEWIGEIPEHWKISKVNYETINLDSRRIPLSSEERGELEKIYDYYGASGVIDKVDKYLFNENLILIGEDGANLLSRSTPLAFIASGKYWVNNHAHILKPAKGNDIHYLCNQLELNDYTQLVTGSAQPKLTQERLVSIRLVIPPVGEQKQIGGFLKKLNFKIDSLISDKEKLIELLKEKRQAIITEAVTKGLNPNVHMKDSGVEWIGEIPEHWELTKLKFTTDEQFMYGANESAELDDVQLPRYIRITDIDDEGNLKSETFKSMEWEKAVPFLLKDKDLLFARSGATVGKTYLYNKNVGPACFAGYLIRYRANRIILPEFVEYLTRTFGYSDWVKLNTIQATIQNVSAEKYKNLEVPIPSIEEQMKIVDYLDNKNIGFNELLNKTLLELTKLREYKQSLISEAVTGKIDVRELV